MWIHCCVRHVLMLLSPLPQGFTPPMLQAATQIKDHSSYLLR